MFEKPGPGLKYYFKPSFVQNFLSLLACINHTDVQCVGDNEILVYPENRFYLQHFQMLVYLYFDSNKKYNAVVKIQKEKNQTGPVPIIIIGIGPTTNY